MSEPEDFLSRWSRRKRAAADPATPPAQDVDLERAGAHTPAARHESQLESPRPADVPEPVGSQGSVDLSKLPSLDSISAATDIRPFLAPGVPVELTRAALRRAWSTDPAIRDFVGLAENQWDFTAPGGIPGFGTLADTEQIRRLVAQVIGDSDATTAAASERPAIASATAESQPEAEMTSALVHKRDDPHAAGEPSHAVDADPGPVPQCNSAAGTPDEINDENVNGRRRHGRALPQ